MKVWTAILTLRAKLYLNGELKKEETVSPTTRVLQSGHYSGYSKPSLHLVVT